MFQREACVVHRGVVAIRPDLNTQTAFLTESRQTEGARSRARGPGDRKRTTNHKRSQMHHHCSKTAAFP